MKELIFVTGNKAKFEWAQRRLAKFGVNLVQKTLNILEPREFEVDKVVEKKAELGMKSIEKPFIIDDTGFQIKALNNFPNSYIKLAMGTLGAEDLCKLMKDREDKTTNFRSALAYVDENRKIHLFICDDFGIIPSEPKGENIRGWNDLVKIHIPQGFNKTLAEMNDAEFEKYENKIEEDDHYIKFIKWFLENESAGK